MAKTSKQKSLVIVESPAKAKTINRYLGPEYEVRASMGHVRDLPSKGLCVDIENDFEPTYQVVPNRKKIVTVLKNAAQHCKNLFLATDLDREGEAIAWHLSEVLDFEDDNTYRVVFNAITKKAIADAFASPGRIDMDKVMAQQARRILDRIVGYQISPLLWKKVTSGLSAGRVQSVAVKIIVERERQIRQFKPEEYWLIPAVFSTDLDKDHSAEWAKFIGDNEDHAPSLGKQYQWLAAHNAFRAELYEVAGQKFHADNGQTAKKIHSALKNAQFSVADITTKRVSSRPSAPFITSTLQQAAANRMGFSAKRTMQIAQQLYEGIDLGSMGALGLITYMRTDSTHLSPEAISSVRHYINTNIGPGYVPEKPNYYASRQGAQQAHEAIRPTDCDLTPEGIRYCLTDEQYKLYDLVWRRFVASQMAPAQWDSTAVLIEAQTSAGTCTYRATGRAMVFDGFVRIWDTASEEQHLPAMQNDQKLRPVDIRPCQHFTKPPARYTEASLIKALEKEGIGRPSTYASIISTIQDRKYVEKTDKKFFATDLGEIVTDKLIEFFPNVMDIAFTRHMEAQLDKIEEQHLNWISVLHEFYGPFKQSLDNAGLQMKHAKVELQPSPYTCPKCGKGLVYRFGKNGKFLSCSAYPDCKFASPCDKNGQMLQDKPSEYKCPACGKPMIYKHGRFGEFLGCSDYPACKTILGLDKDGNVLPPKPAPQPTGLKCYKCKEGTLVIRQSKKGPFMGCGRFPKCRTIINIKQLENLKLLQTQGKWPPASREEADDILGRKSVRKKTVTQNT